MLTCRLMPAIYRCNKCEKFLGTHCSVSASPERCSECPHCGTLSIPRLRFVVVNAAVLKGLEGTIVRKATAHAVAANFVDGLSARSFASSISATGMLRS
jgi:hypothetical protein